MKDEFLATLSHELRTPLNAILGYAQLLRTGVMGQAELADGLEVIERNARAQTQIIEDLLDMSRIISGKVRLDVQPVNLVDVIEAAVRTVAPAADARGIRMQKILDPLAGPVSGDPNRLQQVFWNLLSNAIKFTPKGGRVQVVLQRVNSHVEVTVSDSGVGIKPEFLPYVFDRFRQADATAARRYGGLGLGLAIVKSLVELHGGSVHAASPGEGRGATFVVHLPLSLLTHDHDSDHPGAKAVRRPGSPAEQFHANLADVSILVVDDERDARELVRRLLVECDARVLTAASADEALPLLSADHRPDVLISDIGMPGVDGYEFIRRVRALGPDRGGAVPAVALTAFARSEDRTRAILAGYQMHVAKPVEPAELVAVVASLAGRTA
jgi:CheY-like chemotaxis protein